MATTLFEAYQEPHRHYHTMAHVDACLSLVAEAPLEPADRVVMELAVWFHDVIYEPQASNNELRSAQMATDWMQRVGLDGHQRVAALIEMTAGHIVAATDSAEIQLFHDVDLAILGSVPDEYSAYADQIRAEYSWMTDLEYRKGRCGVLETFLARDTIFALAPYQNAFERVARSNLSDELARLAG